MAVAHTAFSAMLALGCMVGCVTCPLDQGTLELGTAAPCQTRFEPGEHITHAEMWFGKGGLLATPEPWDADFAAGVVGSSFVDAIGRDDIDRITGVAVLADQVILASLLPPKISAFARTDGTLLWSRDLDGGTWCWPASTRNHVLLVSGEHARLLGPSGDQISSWKLPFQPREAAYSARANDLAVAHSSGLRVIDLQSGTEITRMTEPRIVQLLFVEQGTQLLSFHGKQLVFNLDNEPGRIRLWDVASGTRLASWTIPAQVIDYKGLRSVNPSVVMLVDRGLDQWEALDLQQQQVCSLGENLRDFNWIWQSDADSGSFGLRWQHNPTSGFAVQAWRLRRIEEGR